MRVGGGGGGGARMEGGNDEGDMDEDRELAGADNAQSRLDGEARNVGGPSQSGLDQTRSGVDYDSI